MTGKTLQQRLDSSVALHKGYGYDDFIKQVTDGMSVAALATMFGVSRMTIYKWLNQYETERNKT